MIRVSANYRWTEITSGVFILVINRNLGELCTFF